MTKTGPVPSAWFPFARNILLFLSAYRIYTRLTFESLYFYVEYIVTDVWFFFNFPEKSFENDNGEQDYRVGSDEKTNNSDCRTIPVLPCQNITSTCPEKAFRVLLNVLSIWSKKVQPLKHKIITKSNQSYI